MSRSAALWAFVVYTLLWEALIWGGGMWVIVTQGWSPWWVVFLLFVSAAQFKPDTFLKFSDASVGA